MGKNNELDFTAALENNHSDFAREWVREMAQVRGRSGVCNPLTDEGRRDLLQDFEGVKRVLSDPESSSLDVHQALQDIAVNKPEVAGTVALVGHMYFTSSRGADDAGAFDYAVSQGMHMLGQVQMARTFAGAANAPIQPKIENPAATLLQPGVS